MLLVSLLVSGALLLSVWSPSVECGLGGGVWSACGCLFYTTDAGEPCTDSSECEGECHTDWPTLVAADERFATGGPDWGVIDGDAGWDLGNASVTGYCSTVIGVPPAGELVLVNNTVHERPLAAMCWEPPESRLLPLLALIVFLVSLAGLAVLWWRSR